MYRYTWLVHWKTHEKVVQTYFYGNSTLWCNLNIKTWTSKFDLIKENEKIERNRVEQLPKTTGAKDSHKDNGIWWPKTNWDAAALKNGSSAVEEHTNTVRSTSISITHFSKKKKRRLLKTQLSVVRQLRAGIKIIHQIKLHMNHMYVAKKYLPRLFINPQSTAITM